MSGGSWDYIFMHLYDAADRLSESGQPEDGLEETQVVTRRALGAVIAHVSAAMKAVEWVDSDDCSYPHDVEEIRKALSGIEDVLCKFNKK